MNIVKDLFIKLNYVSERKERDNVVSNEFKNVVVDTLLLALKATEKGIIKSDNYVEIVSFIPDNMQAFAKEHAENLSVVINAAMRKVNDLKAMEKVEEISNYKVNVRAA